MNEELDCKAVSRLLSESQDRAMTQQQRVQLRLHLVICEACRHVDAQLAFLRRAMQGLGRDDKPPGT